MCSFGKDGKVKCPEYDSHQTTGGSNHYAVSFTVVGLPASMPTAYRGNSTPSGSCGLEYKIRDSYKD